MGLFDKKKNADFGSPVEQIDLSTQSGRLPAPGALTAPEPSAPINPGAAHQSRYGIREAIELMRMLPAENVDLVVQVVKKTLESANIRIGGIIEDASARQADVEGRISVLRQEISDLDREITLRKAEITRLEADHHEVSLVKDRLLLAEKLSASPVSPPSGVSRTAAAAAESTKASGLWPAGAIPTRAHTETAQAPAQPAAQGAPAPAPASTSTGAVPTKINLPGVTKR